jgi:hypothetical protein
MFGKSLEKLAAPGPHPGAIAPEYFPRLIAAFETL